MVLFYFTIMNIGNVESYLRDNYDRHVLLTYRTVKKFYLRVELVRLDIGFLKTCRTKDIIPKFLWFKTANRNLASSAEYKQSQRRLLNAEINYKYQHLNKLKGMYRSSIILLQQYCSEDLFEQLQEIIQTTCRSPIKEKEQTIEKKLYGHSIRTQPKLTVDPNVVRNLSARVLSNDEINCLAHGLDYALLPRRFDEMGAVGNIEQFFHRVTDIFQHHKKLMADLKDKDKVIPNDIRVLNTKEMTLASNLRSLTDTFQFQANRYRQQQHSIHAKQKPYHQLLKQLKQDKSIIVTRPDKGRGIVLMNRNDYISKMDTILNDSTKFKCRFDDPTISRERRLTNLLLKLKNQGHISKEIYYLTKPTGSRPGRLYGLPKIHKDNIPLRPVVSAVGTYNYGLGKLLKQMLSNVVQNDVVIKDTFGFVNALRSLPKSASKYKMVSFDVSSLYTNIPVNETIEIVLKHLYDTQGACTTIPKDDMKKLLKFATQDSHFLFNGKVYDQIDGVSMGSPLAPLLAEIFLQDFEKKHLHVFDEMGIGYWKRYVDDTFVLLDPRLCSDHVCARLSQLHPAVQFTVEKENKDNNSIPFLDALIQRQAGIGFETKIYRKPTFSGLITKWDSFIPKRYKYNAISSMVYRAIKICSTYQALHDQFEFIRELALNNGYPLAFVESVIRRQLNLIYAPRAIKPTTPETDITVLRVPYYWKPSQIYAKRVTEAVIKQYPLKKVRVVYDVTARLGQHFTTKDPIPTELKSGVVYEATCPQCNAKYIGKTCRHLTTRINEHLSDQKKFMSQTVQTPGIKLTQTISSHVSDTKTGHMKTGSKTRMMEQVSNQRKLLPKPSSLPTTVKKNNASSTNKVQKKVHMTRSQTNKTLAIKDTLTQDDIDEILMNTIVVAKKEDDLVPKSAMSKHLVSTGHVFTDKDFQILLSENHRYRLLVKESLLIRRTNPVLNGTDRSLPLYIYPDGIERKDMKKHNTVTNTTSNQNQISGIQDILS